MQTTSAEVIVAFAVTPRAQGAAAVTAGRPGPPAGAAHGHAADEGAALRSAGGALCSAEHY